MIARLGSYPVMKDSCVRWLGSVPTYWEILPSRAIFEEVKERDQPEAPMLSVTIKQGVIRQQDLLADSSKKDSSNLDKSAYKLVRAGDIAYNKMRAWQGAVGVSDYQGIVSPAYVVQRPRIEVNSRYFHYLLRTPAFAKEAERWSYGITSDMWSLRPEHFKLIYVCLPPLPEQTAIVRFLDYADRRIRRYIRAKQKLIALLEEQKQAIIHQAVTGQIDVRTGQPYPAYKPAGVEWLGKVPAHWEVARLSQFFTLQRGFDITKDQQREGIIPVVSSGGVASYHDRAVAKGPGVVVGRKGTAGAVHYIETDYWAHDTTLWVNDFKRNYPRFIYYVLTILDLKRFDTGSANPTLNRNVIHPERLAFPPPSEQVRIANSLDACLDRLGSAADRAQHEVSLLREYGIRLIADVVTGKLDVRETAAALPEVDPLAADDELVEPIDEDAEADSDGIEAIPEEVQA